MVGFGWDCLTFLKPPVCLTGSVDARHIAQPTVITGATSMTIRTNAKSIGNNDAKSADLATAIRKAWLKASDERKSEIRLDFIVGYIAGRDRLSISDAEAIVEAGKGEGVPAKHKAMIARAVSGFIYHIRDAKTKPSTEARHARTIVSKAHRAAAMDFLGNFEGETLAEQIKAAIAVLNALK